jgi:hypothetical protein
MFTPISQVATALRTMAQDAFDAGMDLFMRQLPGFIDQLNVAGAATDSNRAAAASSATAAAISEAAAAASAGAAAASSAATKWVAGSYGDGDPVWDPLNYLPYRRIGAGASATNPSLDVPHWALQLLGMALGGIALTGNIALTNSSPGCIVVTPSGPGLFMILPVGTSCLKAALLWGVYNAGDYDYGIKDTGGNVLGWIRPKSNVVIGLNDNSTANGAWSLGGAQKTGITAIFDTGVTPSGSSPLLRVAIDANRSAFLYGTTSGLYCVAYDSSSQVWGAPSLVRSAVDSCSAALSGANQLLVFSSSGTSLEAVTITLSGTGLTVNAGTKATDTAAATVAGISPMLAIGSSWAQGYNSTSGLNSYVRLITVSGTTPVLGAVRTMQSSSATVPLLFASGTVLRALHLATSSGFINNLYCEPFTVSGTTLTPGAVANTAAGGSNVPIRAFQNGNGNLVVQYLDGSSANRVAVFKLTGTTEAVTSNVITTSTVAPTANSDYVAISGTKTLFAYVGSTSSSVRFNIHTDTAGIGAVGTELTLSGFSVSTLTALSLSGSTARVGVNGTVDLYQFAIDCSSTSPALASVQSADLNVGLPANSDNYGVRSYSKIAAGTAVVSIGSRKSFEGEFSAVSIRAVSPPVRDTYLAGTPGAAANESWMLSSTGRWAAGIKKMEVCA